MALSLRLSLAVLFSILSVSTSHGTFNPTIPNPDTLTMSHNNNFNTNSTPSLPSTTGPTPAIVGDAAAGSGLGNTIPFIGNTGSDGTPFFRVGTYIPDPARSASAFSDSLHLPNINDAGVVEEPQDGDASSTLPRTDHESGAPTSSSSAPAPAPAAGGGGPPGEKPLQKMLREGGIQLQPGNSEPRFTLPVEKPKYV